MMFQDKNVKPYQNRAFFILTPFNIIYVDNSIISCIFAM